MRQDTHHLLYGYANNPAEIEARQIAARWADEYFQNRGAA
jgi:hypothetical protein